MQKGILQALLKNYDDEEKGTWRKLKGDSSAVKLLRKFLTQDSHDVYYNIPWNDFYNYILSQDKKPEDVINEISGKSKKIFDRFRMQIQQSSQDFHEKKEEKHLEHKEREKKEIFSPLKNLIEKFKQDYPDEPNDYCCPSSFELLNDPILTPCNHIFNASSLTKWFVQESKTTCPLDRKKLIDNENPAVTRINQFRAAGDFRAREIKNETGNISEEELKTVTLKSGFEEYTVDRDNLLKILNDLLKFLLNAFDSYKITDEIVTHAQNIIKEFDKRQKERDMWLENILQRDHIKIKKLTNKLKIDPKNVDHIIYWHNQVTVYGKNSGKKISIMNCSITVPSGVHAMMQIVNSSQGKNYATFVTELDRVRFEQGKWKNSLFSFFYRGTETKKIYEAKNIHEIKLTM